MLNATRHIIRASSSGVHYGEIKRIDRDEVTLLNSRRIWYWEGAATLSQMAVDGVSKPNKCKFTVRVPEITILGVIERIPCSKKAIKSIEGVPEWKV